jgi:putative acetyltransferase
MLQNAIAVELVQTATNEVHDLIEQLDRALAKGYLPEQQHGLSVDAIFEPHIRFFLARVAGTAVGCGGVALFETFGEVKRMYVRENARGHGVAQALLAQIESETQKNGLDTLRLETGDRQLAAIRLYERTGFQPCDAFGDYASMLPREIVASVFYEKRLALTDE